MSIPPPPLPALRHMLNHFRLQARPLRFLTFLVVVALSSPCRAHETSGQKGVLHFHAKGESKGQIVLVSGDEEYRSEESMPMLAKILSVHHGFDCTVLFSMSKDGEYIDPNHSEGVVGWEHLKDADLMIIATRFRKPSPRDGQYISDFLDAGKPIIGLRTATHAFAGDGFFGNSIPFAKFGRMILGEEWVSHHGRHKQQGARGVIEAEYTDHPILKSVGDVFCPSDVYGVTHLTGDDKILMRGAVTESLDPASKIIEGDINEPMQPFAWLHPYDSPKGTTGLSFCTTSGASVDLLNEGLRRMVVNAVFFLLEQPVPEEADVSFVDDYKPSFYGFIREKGYFKELNLQPSEYSLGRFRQVEDPKGTPEWKFP
ncbi:MAG: hypothetical protein AAF802_09605 [Planctomycetota bacterium]